MLATLTSADALTWVSILVKALTYATTLVAAGSVLVACALQRLDADMQRSLAQIAAVAAIAAAALSVLRLPVRASFLMGGSLDGALDPAILGMVADSPLGASVTLRLIGLALILAILVPWRGSQWIAAAGAVVVAASFAFRGHALEEPRLLLGPLITVHILGLAVWIGGFAPLARASARREADVAGPLAQEFGKKALWVVGALVAAGGRDDGGLPASRLIRRAARGWIAPASRGNVFRDARPSEGALRPRRRDARGGARL